MFTKSIRWRFQLWLAFLLVCILSGFGLTAYQLQRINRLNQIDEELQRRLAAVSGDVRGPPPFGEHGGRRPIGEREGRRGFGERFGGPPFGGRGEHLPFRGRGDRRPFDEGREGSPFGDGIGRPPPGPRPGPREIRLSPQTLSLFDESETNGFYFAVWSREGTLFKSSTNAPAGLAAPMRLDADTQPHTRMREPFREAFHFTEFGECVLVGDSITADLQAMRHFALWLFGAGGAVLALGLGGGWSLASRALRPVEDISVAATRISAGNLSERISVAETDNELGRLAGVLNSTFARLEAAFAQQKHFTADASHELRTPLAVIISEAQTTLVRERSAAEYRETVEACLDTAQQMRRLTESLLELARYDAGQERIKYERFNLARTASDCIELARTLAAKRRIEIKSDLGAVECFGDAERIAQVITNLLTNAIHYNRDGGEIRITTRGENGAAVLTVSDTGVGIAAADQPHIFERFYRADKSRSRAEGRSGLGLAISKAIVDSHGGTIEVFSEAGSGSTFTVRFPADSEAPR